MARTWHFTDQGGNSSSVKQTITVNHNTAPDPPSTSADIPEYV
ncbi:MAG: hypothetical protein OEM26_10210 [Saprospiraceae bacterium]|nr:hypothetical protein [Saprospiraceae bacterium]